MKLLPAFVITVIIIAPSVSFAQNAVPAGYTEYDSFYEGGTPTIDDGALAPGQGFVPCSGEGCSTCHFAILANTIIKWLVGIFFLLFAILAVIAGFRLVTSGGNPGALSAAKKNFTNAFIGLIIVLAAWLIVDTIMRGLLANQGNIQDWGPWSQIKCGSQATAKITAGYFEAEEQSPEDDTAPVSVPPDPTVSASCQDVQSLIEKYKGSPIGVNAPGMNQLISCYRSDPAVAALLSSQLVYTYENTNPLCGPTNGNPACGKCAHGVNSCHYGRGTGQGAMAGDFNAKDRSVAGEKALFNALKAAQGKCGGKLLFESDHTHISLNSCSGN